MTDEFVANARSIMLNMVIVGPGDDTESTKIGIIDEKRLGSIWNSHDSVANCQDGMTLSRVSGSCIQASNADAIDSSRINVILKQDAISAGHSDYFVADCRTTAPITNCFRKARGADTAARARNNTIY